MKFTITIEAVQLKETDISFEGNEVKNIGVDGFVHVRDDAGDEFKVSVGQWLVKHSNGSLEVRADIDDFVAEEEPKKKK